LKSTIARGRAVEATRQREAHKFGSDIQSLKKRVTAYERYIKQLKEFVDNEDTEGLVHQLVQN
jgi:hypothetical protein